MTAYGTGVHAQEAALVALADLFYAICCFVLRLFRGRYGAVLAVWGACLAIGLWLTEVISLHAVDHVLYSRLGSLLYVCCLWIAASLMTSVGILIDAWQARQGKTPPAAWGQSEQLSDRDRPGGDTYNGLAVAYISSYHGICPYCCPVADRHTPEHSYAAPDPNLLADCNWLRDMARLAEAVTRIASMIRITYACVLPDHRPFPEDDARHCDNVGAARDYSAIAYFDPGITLRLKVQIRIKQDILANTNVPCSEDGNATQNDSGGWHGTCQIASQRSMCQQAAKPLTQPPRASEKIAERVTQQSLKLGPHNLTQDSTALFQIGLRLGNAARAGLPPQQARLPGTPALSQLVSPMA